MAEYGISRKRRALSSGPLVSRQLWEQPLKARLLAASISLTHLVSSLRGRDFSFYKADTCPPQRLLVMTSFHSGQHSAFLATVNIIDSAWLLAVSGTAWTWNSGVMWAGYHECWHAPSTNTSLSSFSPPLTERKVQVGFLCALEWRLQKLSLHAASYPRWSST